MNTKENKWFYEKSYIGIEPRYTKLSWKIEKILFSGKSKYQKIDFYKSYDHGIIFTLDDIVMLTEKDEFIYHEILSQIAIFTHDKPRKVLIIGGGDYGTAREIIKHSEIELIKMCEIDKLVLEKCIEFFPYAKKVIKDQRLNVIVEDGFDFLSKSNEKYDIILIDSSDPIGESKKLFSLDFIKLCQKNLNKKGIISMQCGSPFYSLDFIFNLFKDYKQIFSKLNLFTANCHSYPGGYWGFLFLSNHYNPITDFKENKYKNLNFKYYNTEIHKSSFIMPNYIKYRLKDL